LHWADIDSQDGKPIFSKGGRAAFPPAVWGPLTDTDTEPSWGSARPSPARPALGRAGLPAASRRQFRCPCNVVGEIAHIFREKIGGNFALKGVGRISDVRKPLRGVGRSKISAQLAGE